jgi:integrase
MSRSAPGPEALLRELLAEVAALRTEVRSLRSPAPVVAKAPPPAPDGRPLSEIMECCIQHHANRPKGWVPKTQRNARLVFRQLLAAVGDKPASSLSLDDAEAFMVATYSGGFSPQWMKLCRTYFKALVHYLMRKEIIHADLSIVWDPIQIGKDDHIRIFHHYSEEEIEALCRHLQPALIRFVWTACFLGQRRGNLVTMTWSWITPDWILVIPSEEFKQRREFRFPICEKLRKILAPRGEPHEKVLPHLPAKDRINGVLKSASRKAGLDPRWAYCHNLRRTCCAWLKKSGVSRDEAKDLMGWGSEDVMMRSYWPETEDSERVAIISKLDRAGPEPNIPPPVVPVVSEVADLVPPEPEIPEADQEVEEDPLPPVHPVADKAVEEDQEGSLVEATTADLHIAIARYLSRGLTGGQIQHRLNYRLPRRTIAQYIEEIHSATTPGTPPVPDPEPNPPPIVPAAPPAPPPAVEPPRSPKLTRRPRTRKPKTRTIPPAVPGDLPAPLEPSGLDLLLRRRVLRRAGPRRPSPVEDIEAVFKATFRNVVIEPPTGR